MNFLSAWNISRMDCSESKQEGTRVYRVTSMGFFETYLPQERSHQCLCKHFLCGGNLTAYYLRNAFSSVNTLLMMEYTRRHESKMVSSFVSRLFCNRTDRDSSKDERMRSTRYGISYLQTRVVIYRCHCDRHGQISIFAEQKVQLIQLHAQAFQHLDRIHWIGGKFTGG